MKKFMVSSSMEKIFMFINKKNLGKTFYYQTTINTYKIGIIMNQQLNLSKYNIINLYSKFNSLYNI